MIKNNKGITLIVLGIMISILFIIAGVTIGIANNNGFIDIAGETAEKQNESSIKQILDSIYLSERNKYNSGFITKEQMIENIKNEIDSKNMGATYKQTTEELIVTVSQKNYNYKIEFEEIEELSPSIWEYADSTKTKVTDGKVTINVGDYVAYEPQTEITTYVISSVDSGFSYGSITYNKDTLNWRVLGVNKTGRLELISDNVTSQNVYFKNYQGYNNGVYLINDMCNTLYGNTNSGTVGRGLAIEDIQNVMKLSEWDYHNYSNSAKLQYGETNEYTGAYYPTMLSLEKGQKVGGTEGTQFGESEQEELITQTTEEWNTTKDIEITQTFWTNTMTANNFIDEIYYTLFINNGTSNYAYWLASRFIANDPSPFAAYGIRLIKDAAVGGRSMCNTDNDSYNNYYNCLRPVVTLGNNIQINTAVGNGAAANTAWGIK